MSLLILQPKKVLTNQIQLIEHTTGFLDEKVNYITLQQGMKSVCKHTESRKTTTLNAKAKVDEKMETRKRENYLSLDDSVLSSIVDEEKRRAEVTGVPGVPRTATSPRRKKLPHRPNLMV